MSSLSRWRSVAAIAAALSAAAVAGSSCAGSREGVDKPDTVGGVSVVTEAESVTAEELPGLAAVGKVLVVYYTTGNAAERVAKDLAALHGAELERIEDARPRRWSFFSGGFAASTGQASPIKEPSRDPADYDRVYVLSPVWAWRLAPPVRSWLRWAKGRLPETAFGTVSGDTEPDKIVAQMEKEGGKAPFAYAGFSEKDFLGENRVQYLKKLAFLVGIKPREGQ